MRPREAPVHDVGLGVDVAQEAEAGRDHRIAILIGGDVHQRHGQHIAALGAFDEDGTGHRVDEIQVDRREIIGHRIERQIGVQCVAGMQDDHVARIGPRHGRYRRMEAVEAVRIVGAVISLLLDHHLRLPGHLRRVGQRKRATKS